MDNASHSDAGGGLQKGSLHWVNVASLGIAIAISGNFSGWNYGLGIGGLGGMAVAAAAMAVLFFGLTQCVAEMAASLPGEAGFDGYTRSALGPSAGFLCGMAVTIALAVGAGLAIAFIEAYASASLGIGGWPVKVATVVIVFGMQLRGARDAVSLTMITGFVALSVLALFCIYVAPVFDLGNWRTATVEPGVAAQGATAWFPHGVGSILQCVPYALFMFLGVEQATLAAAEMRDMSRSLPKALFASVAIAGTIALAILALATGSGGIERLAPSEDPLVAALAAHPARAGTSLMTHVIGAGALLSLLATFFSLVYAGSRQLYHLAAAGDLPRWLATTDARHTPRAALGAIAIVSVGAALFAPEAVMVVFIFLISVAHVLLVTSFVRLRFRRADLPRAYRARGGVALAAVAGLLSCCVLAACFTLQVTALGGTVAALVLLFAYYRLVKLPQARPPERAA
jgi:ethanolamine permease